MFKAMELIAASVVTACATVGLGAARLLSERLPRTKLKHLLDLREKLDDSPAARRSIEEAIDRCALRVVYAERDQFTNFSRVFGLVTGTIGLLTLLVVSIAIGPRTETTPQYVLWIAGIAFVLSWVGGISLILGTRVVFTIYPRSMFAAESREIDDRYEQAKRYRHMKIKRKSEASKKKKIHKRARRAHRRGAVLPKVVGMVFGRAVVVTSR